jgi:hypothetical protein
MNNKLIGLAAGTVLLIILLFVFNPVGYNDPAERTVITQMDGEQFTQFQGGYFYEGFFAKSQTYPNQLSVVYSDSTFDGDLHLKENSVEIGTVKIRFNDATEAEASGIVQFILPTNNKEMLAIHNAHRSPEALVQRRLAPYTKECLQSSSQLMSSEMHYSGGRAQMTQDYLDQLRNGTYILSIKEGTVFDSTDNSKKRMYSVEIKKDKKDNLLRKFSSIKEYAVLLGDAQITNVEYSPQVKEMLKKKIDAATMASVSKQRLMTAEQQKLTAKAEGERKLTEIEYVQKQEQTIAVVKAETQVELAKQDLLKQEIARQAAEKEGAKIKILADAEAYAKQRVMAADGALDKKLAVYERVMTKAYEALGSYTGNIVPTYMSGGSSQGDAFHMFMQTSSMKAMQDLQLNMKNK